MSRTKLTVGNTRTPYQRQKTKAAFLSAYASCAILQRSCDIAHIVPATVRYWLSTGFLQQYELDAAKEQYNDRIRGVLHELAIEGTNKPLNDGHGHILTDASGNPLMSNTKSEKLLLHLANVHLPEHKDTVNGHSSNTVNINIGDIHSTYFVGIDLHYWRVEDVQKLKALIIEAESHKQVSEHSQNNVIDSQ